MPIMEIIVFYVIKSSYALYKLYNIKLFFNVFMYSTYGVKYVFINVFIV